MAIKASDSKAYVYRRVNDGTLATPAGPSSALSLTSGTWYNAKVLVDDDTGNSALQRLRFWVDTDGDGDYADETTLIDSNIVDDNWSAGYAGLFSGPIASSAVQEFDDVKIGLDNSSPKDGDSTDAGDSIIIDDNFNSNATSLTYDDNGNLTDDGLFSFVYDAWNRLVAVKTRYASGTTRTTIGTYAYDGAGRRTKKIVTNNGVEIVANDGGNTTVNFYYGATDPPTPSTELGLSAPWSIFETRNGSNQTTFQYAWGTQYIDEIIFMDKQGDSSGNDVDPDVTTGGETAHLDHRYFYHQDRNWNVTALTDYGSGVNAATVERYSYAPYGEVSVLKDASNGPELAVFYRNSFAGNMYSYQGSVFELNVENSEKRARIYNRSSGRFIVPDKYWNDGMNRFVFVRNNPLRNVDPTGEVCQTYDGQPCDTLGLTIFPRRIGPAIPCCKGNSPPDFPRPRPKPRKVPIDVTFPPPNPPPGQRWAACYFGWENGDTQEKLVPCPEPNECRDCCVWAHTDADSEFLDCHFYWTGLF